MNKIESIFIGARGLDADARGPYLDIACGSDAGLRAEVEALLKADADAGSFLRTTETDPDATVVQGRPAPELVGQQIGRYKLLEQIGEGGFGTVWAAEQREPVKRRVALKIIKLGMDTKQVIARFEAERQALAMMDHPNIARVLDAGSTETGRPYFVMELVKGVPILEYCDREKLDTKVRLDLFMKVCHAIQHAHQKGIIHRDIKPNNVLVTMHDGVPVPKVIDFGIAKATNQELTEKTIYTQQHQMIGTPAYMSPEQAEEHLTIALEIRTRVLGEEHPDTLESMNSMATLYSKQGQYTQAESLYTKALEIRERVLGEENSFTLESMNNLANVYKDQGRYAEAEPLHKNTLEIQKRVLGMEHPWTGYAMRGLATAYDHLDRHDEALPLWREWLGLQTAKAESPDADAPTLNAAAWTLLTHNTEELRDPARALGYAERACAAEEAANGANLWTYLDTLALAQHLTGDDAKAVETQKRAISLMPSPDAEPEMAERLAQYEASLNNE